MFVHFNHWTVSLFTLNFCCISSLSYPWTNLNFSQFLVHGIIMHGEAGVFREFSGMNQEVIITCF